ncbi:MAG TPA: CdaR family protein [Bacillota bacterium]|nr:CdaR family protein [Bacillota bacterium]
MIRKKRGAGGGENMDKWFGNKWFVRGVSLAFAILLYVFVYFEGSSIQSDQSRVPSGTDTVQVLEQVPVDIKIDSEKYVVSGVPDYVTVTLEGPNSILIPAARQQNFSVFVDLMDLEEGEHTVDIEYERVPDELDIYIEPKTVSITIEERASAEFQVQLEFINQDELPFGYELGETTIEPETITVTSSRSLIEQIAIVKVYIDVEGLTEPINKREVPINVYDSQGNGLDVNTNPERVLVSVNVDNPSKEVSVEVDTVGELRDDLQLIDMTVDPETVEVFARNEVLEDIESVLTEAVDLSKITSSGSNTVNLVLPEDTNAEEDEVTITYEIEQTITFEDVPIDIENREADETVEIINNDEIVNTITITGEESIIKELSIEDFRLYVDIGGLGEGEHVVPVSIEIPEDVSDDIEVELEFAEITINIS